jgi:hypothetical protein
MDMLIYELALAYAADYERQAQMRRRYREWRALNSPQLERRRPRSRSSIRATVQAMRRIRAARRL